MSRPVPTLRDVLEQLRPDDRSGDAAAADALKKADEAAGELRSPWFVRAMVAVSAWIASILFLTFLIGSRLVTSSGGGIVAGAMIICGAVVLRRVRTDSPFLAQLGLALSLAGQVLFIGGVGEQLRGEAGSVAAVLVSVALVLFYPDKTHRFLSTLIAVGGAVAFVHEVRLSYGVQVLAVALAAAGGHLWFNESRLLSGTREALMRPVAYGLIAGALLLLLPSVVSTEFRRHLEIAPGWTLATAALTVLLLLLEYRLLAFHNGVENRMPAVTVFAGTVALAAVSYNAPGIIGALFVLATGFHRGNRIITGLAIAFLGVFLTAYYYNMQITLLVKSYALLASGAVLLLLRLLLLMALPGGDREAAHE
jgi:uncharacterized membrane protein